MYVPIYLFTDTGHMHARMFSCVVAQSVTLILWFVYVSNNDLDTYTTFNHILITFSELNILKNYSCHPDYLTRKPFSYRGVSSKQRCKRFAMSNAYNLLNTSSLDRSPVATIEGST